MVLILGNLDYMSRVQELQGFYSGRNGLFVEARRMANNVTDIKRPNVEGALPQLPTAYTIVQHACGILGAQRPRIRVPRKKDTKKAQENAELLEQFLIGSWYRIQRERRNHALRRAIWHGVVDGWFCLKTLWDVAAEERARYPIKVSSRDPSTIYPQPTDERPEYVAEQYLRTVGDIKNAWADDPDIPPLVSHRDTDTVVWTEWWDEQDVRYFINGNLFKHVRHDYGFVPHSIGYAAQTPLMDGRAMGIGLLPPIMDILKREQELFSQQSAIIQKYAWPALLVESGQGDKFKLDLRPGGINYLLPGESVNYLEWKSTSPQIQQFQEQVRSHLERSSFSGLQYGERPVSGTSGYLGSILASAAQIKINPLKTNLENAIEECNENMERLVEQHVPKGEVLSVDGVDHRNKDFEVSIGPEDIDGYYRNHVELRATLPEDEVQKAMTGLRLVQAGIISRMTAREKYAEVESPQEEEKIIIREKVMEHPLVMGGLGLKFGREWGLDVSELAAQMQQAQEANAGGMPSPREDRAPQQPPTGEAQGSPRPTRAMPPVDAASAVARGIQPVSGDRPGPKPQMPGQVPTMPPSALATPPPRGPKNRRRPMNPPSPLAAPAQRIARVPTADPTQRRVFPPPPPTPPSAMATRVPKPPAIPAGAPTTPGIPRVAAPNPMAGMPTMSPGNPVPEFMRKVPPLAPLPPSPIPGMPAGRVPVPPRPPSPAQLAQKAPPILRLPRRR